MEKKRNISHYPLIMGFLAMLVLPVLNSAFGIWKYQRVSENRSFTDSLTFNVDHLDLFPDEAESYMNDNFSFRKPLLDLFHEMKYYAFNTSPHPDKLVIGSNGWYYMADKELADYQGKNNFSKDTLDLFLSEWKRRKAYFDKKGIQVYWMIAPTAHDVYPEFLPFQIQAASESRVTQLKNHFKRDLPTLILDPLPVLIAHKKDAQLYCKQDNHWNFHAGNVTHHYFLQRLRMDFPGTYFPVPQISKWKNIIEYNGIHRVVLGINMKGEQKEVPLFKSKQATEVEKYNFPVVSGFFYHWEFERRFKNENITKGKRIVIIRDSFGDQVMPFMSESFSETVFIFDAWQYKLNEHIIDAVQPDIVLFMMVETHLEAIVTQF